MECRCWPPSVNRFTVCTVYLITLSPASTMPRRTTRFEDLAVWQKSRALAGDVYKASNNGPFARDFGLRDQLRRAAVCVMSNIAEGFGR